jgi:hypothetical protein
VLRLVPRKQIWTESLCTWRNADGVLVDGEDDDDDDAKRRVAAGGCACRPGRDEKIRFMRL